MANESTKSVYHASLKPLDSELETEGCRHSKTDMYFSGLEWDDGKDRVENEIYFQYNKIARTTKRAGRRSRGGSHRPARGHAGGAGLCRSSK